MGVAFDLKEHRRKQAVKRATEWAAANPERARENKRRSAEKHRDKKRAADRKRAKTDEHRAKRRAYMAEYRAKNREKVNAYQRERNRLNRGAPLDATAKGYAGIVASDPCAYCGGIGTELEHIVPVTAGGDSSWDNLAWACRTCNASKYNKSLLHFLLTR